MATQRDISYYFSTARDIILPRPPSAPLFAAAAMRELRNISFSYQSRAACSKPRIAGDEIRGEYISVIEHGDDFQLPVPAASVAVFISAQY